MSKEASLIGIEVAYARPDRQLIVEVEVPRGTSVFDGAVMSKIDQAFTDLTIDASTSMGIWGKRIPKPDAVEVGEGDRIEIYRPLLIDPKEIRRQRANKNA